MPSEESFSPGSWTAPSSESSCPFDDAARWCKLLMLWIIRLCTSCAQRVLEPVGGAGGGGPRCWDGTVFEKLPYGGIIELPESECEELGGRRGKDEGNREEDGGRRGDKGAERWEDKR